MTLSTLTAQRPQYRSLPAAFWLLWAGMLINRVATFVLPFLMLFLVRQRGVDPVLASTLLALNGGGLACSNLIGGYLADRIGRRPTTIMGLLATGGMMFLLAIPQGVWSLAVSLTVLGLVMDLYRPAVNALVSDLLPPESRTFGYSVLHWAINLGMSVGMLAGGAVVEFGFIWLFLIDGATNVAFAVLVWRLLPRLTPKPSAKPSTIVDHDLSKTVHSAESPVPTGVLSAPLLLFSAISFIAFTIYFQSSSTLPLAVTDIGLAPSDFGVIMAVNGMVVAVVQPLLAGHLNMVRPTWALSIAYILIGIGFGLTALAGGILGMAVSVALWSLGEVALMAAGTTYVVGIAPPSMRGRYIGVHGMAVAAASTTAPLLGTAVYEWNSAVLWGACTLLGIALALVQLATPAKTTKPRVLEDA